MPPTLADLLATELECPPPTGQRPLPGYDLVIAAPENVIAGDRFELEVRPGVINAPGGGLCASVTGRTVRGAERSEAAVLSQPALCVPVDEPGFVVGLGVALGWLALGAWLGPRLGRWLKQNGDRYPVPRETKGAETRE